MKEIKNISSFSLLAVETDKAWELKISYPIFVHGERNIHTRFLLTYRQTVKQWKNLEGLIMYVAEHQKLRNFDVFKIAFQNGLIFTTTERE